MVDGEKLANQIDVCLACRRRLPIAIQRQCNGRIDSVDSAFTRAKRRRPTPLLGDS